MNKQEKALRALLGENDFKLLYEIAVKGYVYIDKYADPHGELENAFDLLGRLFSDHSAEVVTEIIRGDRA